MKMAASFDVVHTLPVHCPSSCEYCASGGPPMCSLEGRKRHLVGEISNGVCKKNKGAGEYWCASDPYWHGLPAMHRYFHMDGSVSADPEDPIWGGHECSWTLSKRNKHASVRINHWPPLVTTRTSSWGWRLENCWVIYQSTAAQNTR
eukprot:Gb_34887 [translate_table: standard]